MSVRGRSKLGSRLRSVAARRWRGARAVLRRSLAVKAGLPERAEDILTSILNISSEGVVVADAELRILVFSKGAEQIFGYAASEVVGRSLDVLIPSDQRSAHQRHVERFAAGAVLSRRMHGRNEIAGRTKAGDIVPLEVGLSKLAASEGLIYTAIVRDISERRLAEAALFRAADEAKAANEAKTGFLATMSHEIRTPLNGVLGMAQAMAREELPANQQARLAVIRESGEALLEILNDLLDLSKIEAGRLELEETVFELEEVVRGVHRTFGAVAAQKGLEFRLRIEPRAGGSYRGDPLRVRQILNNLISNAIKFTESGWVEVAVRRRAGVLMLQVRDSGVGIAEDRMGRLFQKFEQGDASTTRRFGGTGLGLAICRDLARLMGGDIAVSSSEGEGAAFEVALRLPRVPRQPRCDTQGAPHPDVGLPHMDVLVAEDNPTNQLVIQTLLTQLGVAPAFVSDGRAAVAAWAERRFDMILMDVQMPDMDGPTAASIIRASELAEGRPRTPILALTANAMSHQLHEYRQAGMDGLIAKPIVVEELAAALAKLVEPAPSGDPRD